MDAKALVGIFSQKAAWREEKAKAYPKNAKNAAAAIRLRKLARTAKHVETSLLVVVENSRAKADVDLWNDMLMQIGFSSFPDTADEFVRDFINRRSLKN